MASTDISVDLSELVQLADELEGAPARIVEAVTPPVKRGAMNIKREAQASARAQFRSYAAIYPSSITYDVSSDDTSVTAEIGPDKDRRQGALGNLLEYGSSNNPPYPHLNPAAEREAPRAQVQIAKAALKAMLGGE